jgi:ABC-2 type transport system ATP-binding protein
MQEIRDGGRTLFYVSHAAGSVRRMCDRVLVLEQGRLAFDGEVNDGIRFVKYDGGSGDDPQNEELEDNLDEELGADI